MGNHLLYNFGVGGGGAGADLYGTEPWSFYAKNLVLDSFATSVSYFKLCCSELHIGQFDHMMDFFCSHFKLDSIQCMNVTVWGLFEVDRQGSLSLYAKTPRNLLLNFNLVALLAFPSLLFTWKRWRLFLMLTPMYVTLAPGTAWVTLPGVEFTAFIWL